MNNRKHLFYRAAKLGAVSTMALIAGAAAAQSGAPADQPAVSAEADAAAQQEEQGARLEEIVVTASKRTESLQDVAISIRSLSGEEISKSGAQTFQDIVGKVPALSARSAGPGRQKLTLRGISSSAGVAPTVGFYIDEAPLAPSSSASNSSFQQTVMDPNLFDLARIEVLRGPQGTLYGSSSMGGTVKLVTNIPNVREFEGKANGQLSSTKDGGLNWEINGLVNIPIVQDVVALRLIGTYIENEGYIDRLVGNYDATGAINGPLPSDVILPNRELPAGQEPVRYEDVNNEKTRSIRALLRIEPTSDIYIQPSIFWQKTNQDGKPNYDSIPGTREQRRSQDVAEPFQDEFIMANLTAEWDAGPVSLLSTTTYVDRDLDNVEDLTDVISYFFGYSQSPDDLPAQRRITGTGQIWALDGPPFPATVQSIASPAFETVRIKDFTQEFRLTSDSGGRFRWIAGLYFKHLKTASGYELVIPGYRETFPAYDIILGNVFGNNFALVQNDSEYKEYAAFGEANFDILDRLTLTLGARAFKYETEFARTTQGLFFGRPTPGTVISEASAQGINPKLSIAYDVTDDVKLYATAARGYRPGATNTPVPAGRCDADLANLGLTEAPEEFGPDKLWNYELGAKTRLLNRRVTLNAAAYQIIWKDIQQKVTLPTCGASYSDNVGSARSRGVEVELNALVTEAFEVSAGVSYNKASFSKDSLAAGVREGDDLLDAPRWTLNLTGEYTLGRVAGGDIYIRGAWSYVDDSLDTLDQTSSATGIRTPGIRKKSYDIADFRIGYSSDQWEGSIFILNAFDEQAELTKTDTLGQLHPLYFRIATNRPRTIGLSISRNF